MLLTILLNYAIIISTKEQEVNEMFIEKGMVFRGNVNGESIRIMNVTNKAVVYKCLKSGKVFTYGREAFNHLLITKIL